MRPVSRPPAPATALLGRATDIAEVAASLDAARLVTLTGPPGVGKTRLALAAAAAIADRFADGTAWVDLTPISDPRQVGAEIARAVDTGFDPEVLLVMDNCEHLLDAAPAIGDLLVRTTRLRILATSRERLRLSAEHEHPVPPLPMPGEPEIEDWAALRKNPSVAVLLARAPASVTVTPQTARNLAEICVRLDGLPLALELAAARLRVFTPAELAYRLEHRMASLAGGPRDAPARHRDLRAAIAWSYELLSERDRAVFRRLAVFPNDWTVGTAEIVCAIPDVLDAVESLLDKNLVRRVGESIDGARFSMLVSLREFAAEQLDAREAAEARDRHAAHFADGAREWEATVGTAAENATWTLFGAIRADLRAALEHSRTGNDPDATLWLAAAVGWYRFTRGTFADSDVLLDAISTARADERASADAIGAATIVAGVLAYARRDAEVALRELRRAADLARTRADDRHYAITMAFLGHLARDRGDPDEAREDYETARDIYAWQGNVRGLAWAAHDLGLLDVATGDAAAAQEQLREAVRRFEQLDYPWAVASAVRALGAALLLGDDVAEAAAVYHRAFQLHGEVGDRRGIAECLEGLAEVAYRRGEHNAAARLAGAAQAQRSRGGAAPNDDERDRSDALATRLTAALGISQFDHEQQAGRTMPYPAVVELAARMGATVADGAARVRLTARQWQVAELIAAGNTNRQIGRQLGISEKTTEIHVHNIMSRTRTTSRAGVAAWLVRNGPLRTP